MSWLYSRALVEEYSEANYSDGAPYAPLRSSPTPQAYLSPDRMTDFCRLSRFGMTFERLTEDLGEDVLTWYLAGFPVRTSAQRDMGQESKANAQGSGWRWGESLASFPQTHTVVVFHR